MSNHIDLFGSYNAFVKWRCRMPDSKRTHVDLFSGIHRRLLFGSRMGRI